MKGTKIRLTTPLQIDVAQITQNIKSTNCIPDPGPRQNGDHNVTRDPGIEDMDNSFVKICILNFRGKTAAGFTEIYSDYDVFDLRVLLASPTI
jgi:hypothetical protein